MSRPLFLSFVLVDTMGTAVSLSKLSMTEAGTWGLAIGLVVVLTPFLRNAASLWSPHRLPEVLDYRTLS